MTPGQHPFYPEIGQIEKGIYNLLDFNGLQTALAKFIQQMGGEFVSGQPLTERQKQLLKALIDHHLKPPGSIIEQQAVRAYMTGSVLHMLEQDSGTFRAQKVNGTKPLPRKININKLPSTVKQSAAINPKIQPDKVKLHIDNLGNEIQNISDSARAKVTRTILETKQAGSLTTQNLTQRLRDQHFDEESNLNRDWRRVAITEAANLHTAGYFDQAHDPGKTTYVKFNAHHDACTSCKGYDDQVFILTDQPGKYYGGLEPGSTEYESAKKYWDTRVWTGKTNMGRYQSTQAADGHEREHHELIVPTIPIHPNCRCRWTTVNRDLFYVKPDGFFELKQNDPVSYQEYWARVDERLS